MKFLTAFAVLALLAATEWSPLRTAQLPDEPSIPRPSAPAPAQGLLETNTLFSVYGRGFGVAPILGRLGQYENAGEMSDGIRPWVSAISGLNDGKGVAVGIHLIYALAVPCSDAPDCLIYLPDRTVDRYIDIARDRDWVVILDTQLGRSTPVAQIDRMIRRGFLAHDNVHIAIDPEFHAAPGQRDPGIPIGTIPASQLNEVQRILDDYVTAQSLPTKKILIVHQFGDPAVHDGVPYMIRDKSTLQTYDNVELVIDADGLGSPFLKVHKYDRITSRRIYPFIRFRGIKVFFPNRWEKRGHFDKPPMTVDQIFRISPHPDVLIIA